MMFLVITQMNWPKCPSARLKFTMTPPIKVRRWGFKLYKGMEGFNDETNERWVWLVSCEGGRSSWFMAVIMMFLFFSELYFIIHMTLVTTYELCGTPQFTTHIISTFIFWDKDPYCFIIILFYYNSLFYLLHIHFNK